MTKLHFQRGSGELGRQDHSSRTARHCFRSRPTQLCMQDDQCVPACQGHPQLQSSRSHFWEAPWSQANENALSLWFHGSVEGKISHQHPRGPQEPLSPLPTPPPPLFTDGEETSRLKTEGKSRDTGHNHPGLGTPPHSHGLQDSPRCPCYQLSSPEVGEGAGFRNEVKRERQGGRSGNCILREGLEERVQPHQSPWPAPSPSAAAICALVAPGLCLCVTHLPG